MLKPLMMSSAASVYMVLAGCSAISEQEAPVRVCSAETFSDLTDVTVTEAETISSQAKWLFPPSPFNGPPELEAGIEADFCRLAGTIEDEIDFEVWMPADWNGRFQGVGNGGLTGALHYPAMAEALTDGYAVASTDTGHKTPVGFFDASWVSDHPQRVENFGHRGHHLMAVAGKAATAVFYGEPSAYNYYTGCSSGGWQGLTEAQRYPDDYDGILAIAPAQNFIRLQTRAMHLANVPAYTDAPALGDQENALLASAAVAACDADDGVTDGVIAYPEACDFDIASLTCGPDSANDCLTPDQVERAKLAYGRLSSPDGLRLYPANAPGAIAEFRFGGPDASANDAPMITYMEWAYDWSPETFDADRDVVPMEAEWGEALAALETDLSAFRDNGGKLIMWHGWTDALLSPFNTIDYAADMQAATANADDFSRLFMAPGVDHCRGGKGPDVIDALNPLREWVENGIAPETLTAAKIVEGEVSRTGLLCRYPAVAVLQSGTGDSADDYICKAPE